MAFSRRWSLASSSKSHLFEEGRALQREGCVCSQTSRPSSRRRHFLADGRALHRANGVSSKKAGHFNEKMAFVRRRSRPSSRKRHFLADVARFIEQMAYGGRRWGSSTRR